MIRCAVRGCNWEIDEEIYKTNQLGLEEACLLHYEKHKKDHILSKYFFKTKTQERSS